LGMLGGRRPPARAPRAQIAPAPIELGARSPLKNIASVAFGGAYLGNLAGHRIATFRAPIAGAEPVQWRFWPKQDRQPRHASSPLPRRGRALPNTRAARTFRRF
jgi:hypothetical protein